MTDMARIIIPGGTGYLGRALAARLIERGDDIVILTRGQNRQGERVRFVHWDANRIGEWIEHLDGADAVVHLNGRRVDTRSTRHNIDELISSRVNSVRTIGQALPMCSGPPPVWIQSSSLAIFGEGGDQIIDEASTPSGIGPREMVTVCLAWESAFHQASLDAERTVLLRMGIGLGGEGDPATAKLAQLVRLGLGGKLDRDGNGCPGSTSTTCSPSCSEPSPTRPCEARTTSPPRSPSPTPR
jgi:NAD dependent epimerase/dehydratase family enzyme